MTGIFARVAVAIGTSIELSIIMKVTAVVGLTLIVTRLARRAGASVRHVALASAFGTLLTLPLVAILLPPVDVDVPTFTGWYSTASPAMDQNGPPGHVIAGADPSHSIGIRPAPLLSTLTLFHPTWAAGAMLFLVPVALGLWRVRRSSGFPVAHWRKAAPTACRRGRGRPAEGFDIEAKAEGNPHSVQLISMLRTLLADRFKLRTHTETRELPLYALVMATNDRQTSPQLKRSVEGACDNTPPTGGAPPAPVTGDRPRCGCIHPRDIGLAVERQSTH